MGKGKQRHPMGPRTCYALIAKRYYYPYENINVLYVHFFNVYQEIHSPNKSDAKDSMMIKKKDLLIKDCSLRRQVPKCGKGFWIVFDKSSTKSLKDAWWM